MLPRTFAGLAAGSLFAVLSATASAQPGSTVRPGDDFYAYANAAWLRDTTLPPGRASYDTTAMLRDQATARVRAIVQAAAAAPTSPQTQRIGDYYAGWMDIDRIDARGLAPLAVDLQAIAAIQDRGSLSAYLGRTLRLDDGSNSDTGSLLGLWVHQGFHDGRRQAAHLVQGGLGLGRDDYLDSDPAAGEQRDRYRAHLAAMLRLAGFDRADERAARVLTLETAIARTHAPRAHTDDVFKTDNRWRRTDFAEKAPGLDWTAYFRAAGLARQDEIIVWQPTAVTGSAALVGDQPLEAWRDYLAAHLIRRSAAVLPRALRDAEARFSGAPADRTQQAIDAATDALGQDIGQVYVRQHVPPDTKAAAQAMAEKLRRAFAMRISSADWMAPETRKAALAKLAALKIGVGYPDTWIDHAGLQVRRDDAYGNLRRAHAFAYREALARLRRPVDPGEWSLLPQWPGAVINFSPNAIQFSAGILQPPYFDPAGDAATNYGSAGAGMAHEISHSFDDLGNVYDAEGRLVRWWAVGDAERYRAAAAPLAALLAASCPKPPVCLNAPQVLGEAIGDLAGLNVAYDAYLLSLGGQPDVIKDDLTGDQRFFLSFARRWRRMQTDAALEQQVATDSHAPGADRAATVRHHAAWVRAFDVKPGDRLYLPPEARADIW